MKIEHLRPDEKLLLADFRQCEDCDKNLMVVQAYRVAGKTPTPLMKALLEAQAALVVAA